MLWGDLAVADRQRNLAQVFGKGLENSLHLLWRAFASRAPGKACNCTGAMTVLLDCWPGNVTITACAPAEITSRPVITNPTINFDFTQISSA